MAAEKTIRRELPAWPEWMDIRTLCLYASVSERTVREWIHRIDNRLPASQVGVKIRINKRVFDAWMESQTVTAEEVDIDRVVDEVLSGISGGR